MMVKILHPPFFSTSFRYISSPMHSRAYLHHWTHEVISLKITNPQLLHATLRSFEKISTSSPHCGHFFIDSVGVRRFAAPGQWSSMRDLVFLLTLSLTRSQHLILPQECFFVFRHLFCRNVIELLDTFDNFSGDRFIIHQIQTGNIQENPVQPVDAGFFSVNRNFLDFYLVRRDTSTDCAIISVLIVPARSLLPDHGQGHLEPLLCEHGMRFVGWHDDHLAGPNRK